LSCRAKSGKKSENARPLGQFWKGLRGGYAEEGWIETILFSIFPFLPFFFKKKKIKIRI